MTAERRAATEPRCPLRLPCYRVGGSSSRSACKRVRAFRTLYSGRKPAGERAFALLRASALESGRQDLNLRPPGPQPGALPDCATPRGSSQERATGIEPALEAWKAS